MKNAYPISFEIGGEIGLFADPQSGSMSYSLPIPSPISCEGMIRNIAWTKGTEINIVAIAINSNNEYMEFNYNSTVSPHRLTQAETNDVEKHKNSSNIRNTVLFKPRFSILALISNADGLGGGSAHAMKDMIDRRLKKGQSYKKVVLGRSEMGSNYLGEIKTPINKNINLFLPCVNTQLFNSNQQIEQKFTQVLIKNGVAHLETQVLINQENLLSFGE